MPLPDTTRRRWHTAGNQSQRIAARLDTWAASKPPGTIVPADDVIVKWYPVIDGSNGQPWQVTPATVRRAIRLLADRAILQRDEQTGHYHVAAPRPALQVS
jgi:hypothetical protein